MKEAEKEMANSKKASKQCGTGKRNNTILIIIAAIAVFTCVAVILFLPKNGDGNGQNAAGAVNGGNDVQIIAEGESLKIPVSEVTDKASFYPVEVNGTSMEVIAVKDSDGNIRTAFNTCQICYNSGNGYYVQSGSYLVCQNCGNKFTVDQVEIETGGCNPWPIFEENKTVTDEYILISYDFLKESSEIFAKWKTGI